MSAVKDVLGYLTEFDVDNQWGRITKVTYPSGKQTFINYDDNGYVKQAGVGETGYSFVYDYNN